MELSPAYIKWREDTILEGIRQGLNQGLQQGLQQGLDQGLQQGLQQGVERQRLMLEALLRTRFGELDEALLGIIDSLLVLSPDRFMPLCLQLSREELLERFGRSRDR